MKDVEFDYQDKILFFFTNKINVFRIGTAIPTILERLSQRLSQGHSNSYSFATSVAGAQEFLCF